MYNEVEEEQLFGKIIRNTGGHFVVLGTDNIERIGKLKTAMKRGPRIGKDSYVAFSLRSFSDKNECDIIGIARPPQNIIKLFTSFDTKLSASDIDFDYNSENDEFKNLEKIKVADTNDDYGQTDYMNIESESEYEYEYEDEDDNNELNDVNFEKYENTNQDIDFENLDFDEDVELTQKVTNEGLEDLDIIEELIDDNNFKKKNKSRNKITDNIPNSTQKKDDIEDDINKDVNFDNIDFDDI